MFFGEVNINAILKFFMFDKCVFYLPLSTTKNLATYAIIFPLSNLCKSRCLLELKITKEKPNVANKLLHSYEQLL